MLLILIGLAASNPPVVMSREPRLPADWEQTVSFQCGDQTVRISGYGAARPIDRAVVITINGQPASGGQMESLRRDLGHRRAAYRITGLCPQSQGQVAIVVSMGEKPRIGEVTYHSGSATFLNGRIVEYSGLSPSDAESFWFR